MDPDEAGHSDSILNLKEFFEKVDFKKLSRRQKNMQNFPVGLELKPFACMEILLAFRSSGNFSTNTFGNAIKESYGLDPDQAE